MADCIRCGKKLSIFEASGDGLCPKCKLASSPGAVAMAQAAEQKKIEQEREAANKKAMMQRGLETGELPRLPCISPVAIEMHNNTLVFVDKKAKVSVPLQNIASFILKKPTAMTRGVITVLLQKGANYSNNVILSGAYNCLSGDEIVAIFEKQYLELAEVYEEYVSRYSGGFQPTKAAPAAPDMDKVIEDLRALKVLVDEGILTEEEFAAKKKQVLGI